jgi:hypothetical protein
METVSAFRDQMRDTDQCEGFCEMVVTIMFYRLFKKEKYPSNVKEYWMGWRLCMQALNHFLNAFRNKLGVVKSELKTPRDKLKTSACPTLEDLLRLSVQSILNMAKLKGNLYLFVDKVPSDAYRNRPRYI